MNVLQDKAEVLEFVTDEDNLAMPDKIGKKLHTMGSFIDLNG